MVLPSRITLTHLWKSNQYQSIIKQQPPTQKICLLETKHEKSVALKSDLDLKKNEGFPFPAEERSSRLVLI